MSFPVTKSIVQQCLGRLSNGLLSRYNVIIPPLSSHIEIVPYVRPIGPNVECRKGSVTLESTALDPRLMPILATTSSFRIDYWFRPTDKIPEFYRPNDQSTIQIFSENGDIFAEGWAIGSILVSQLHSFDHAAERVKLDDWAENWFIDDFLLPEFGSYVPRGEEGIADYLAKYMYYKIFVMRYLEAKLPESQLLATLQMADGLM